MNLNSTFNMSFNVGLFQPLILIACFLSSIYSRQLFQTFVICIFPLSLCVCCLSLHTHLVPFCRSELVCFWIFDVLINLSSLWYVIWSCCPLFTFTHSELPNKKLSSIFFYFMVMVSKYLFWHWSPQIGCGVSPTCVEFWCCYNALQVISTVFIWDAHIYA